MTAHESTPRQEMAMALGVGDAHGCNVSHETMLAAVERLRRERDEARERIAWVEKRDGILQEANGALSRRRGELQAERDEARAWARRWKAGAKRWFGLARSWGRALKRVGEAGQTALRERDDAISWGEALIRAVQEERADEVRQLRSENVQLRAQVKKLCMELQRWQCGEGPAE